jgi:ribosome biogenesis ATPase
MNLADNVDFALLGKLTPGFVGADLQALSREAGMIAVCRILKNHPLALQQSTSPSSSSTTSSSSSSSSTSTSSSVGAVGEVDEASDTLLPALLSTARIEMADFLLSTKSIQPTAKREGFAVAPEVTWNDIGALSEVREELKHNVLEPIAHPDRFRALGLDVPAGVLFYGPPGCGKTLLAKALANQSGANFISVKGPELLNMFVGESESRVRQVFARARASAPCVIFFDELDALCPKRSSGWEGSSGGGGGGGGSNVSERVVNQLLTELDGLESRKDVYIIAATNRLELIDDAMLRPGRLGNLLYVPLPTAPDRASILKALTKKVALDVFSAETNTDGVDLEKVAMDPRAEGFSGADLSALVREAGLAVIKEVSDADDNNPSGHLLDADKQFGDPVDAAHEAKYQIVKIQKRHFEAAFQRVKPSVNPQDRER